MKIYTVRQYARPFGRSDDAFDIAVRDMHYRWLWQARVGAWLYSGVSVSGFVRHYCIITEVEA